MECWRPAFILAIAGEAGEAISLDSFTEKQRKKGFARVKVRLDALRPLKPGVMVQAGEEHFWQQFQYENLPALCFMCGLLGHYEEDCPCRSPPPSTQKPRLGPWISASRIRQPRATPVGGARGAGPDAGANPSTSGPSSSPPSAKPSSSSSPPGSPSDTEGWQKPSKVARRSGGSRGDVPGATGSAAPAVPPLAGVFTPLAVLGEHMELGELPAGDIRMLEPDQSSLKRSRNPPTTPPYPVQVCPPPEPCMTSTPMGDAGEGLGSGLSVDCGVVGSGGRGPMAVGVGSRKEAGGRAKGKEKLGVDHGVNDGRTGDVEVSMKKELGSKPTGGIFSSGPRALSEGVQGPVTIHAKGGRGGRRGSVGRAPIGQPVDLEGSRGRGAGRPREHSRSRSPPEGERGCYKGGGSEKRVVSSLVQGVEVHTSSPVFPSGPKLGREGTTVEEGMPTGGVEGEIPELTVVEGVMEGVPGSDVKWFEAGPPSGGFRGEMGEVVGSVEGGEGGLGAQAHGDSGFVTGSGPCTLRWKALARMSATGVQASSGPQSAESEGVSSHPSVVWPAAAAVDLPGAVAQDDPVHAEPSSVPRIYGREDHQEAIVKLKKALDSSSGHLPVPSPLELQSVGDDDICSDPGTGAPEPNNVR